MAIDKLTAGVNAKDPAGSTGTEVAAAVNALIDKSAQIVNVLDFGATGIGDQTAPFNSAALAAEANGSKIVYIPFPSFQVADGTNGRQCVVIGAQTVLTGRINNHAGFVNVIINGANQSDKQVSPRLSVDDEPRILWRQSATLDYVIQRKKSRGYMLAGFIINSTTAGDSLATSSTDPNRRRMSEVRDAVWCGVYKYTPSLTNGAGWAEATSSAGTAFANLIPANNSGQPLKRYTTSNAGEYIEYQVKQKNGAITVAFLAGTGSCELATISINGTSVASVNIPAAAGNTIKQFTIPATNYGEDQTVTVRITHAGTGGKAMGVIGVQFFELKDWNGSEYDSFAYYRNTATYSEYLTQASSNDAVIQEFNSQIYGVAYHGGETSIVHDWYVDNTLQNPALNGFVVGRKIELRTSADVSWSSVGGGDVNVKSTWEFGIGCVNHTAKFRGTNLEVREIYAHMFGTREEFSEIVYPSYIDLSAAPDNSRNNVGRTNRITLRNPTTGQTYTGELTLYEREQNRYGGVHVWKKSGQYHKVYYGPVLGGRMTLNDFTCTSVHTFE